MDKKYYKFDGNPRLSTELLVPETAVQGFYAFGQKKRKTLGIRTGLNFDQSIRSSPKQSSHQSSQPPGLVD